MKSNDKIFAATVLTGAVAMAALCFVSPIPAAELSGDWYEDYSSGLELEEDFAERCGIDGITFVDTDDLTMAQLVGNARIAERIIGVCLDADGNGQIINTDSEYDYIHYPEFINPGEIVCTYALYVPGSYDDIEWIEYYVIDNDTIIEENN